MYIWLVFWFLTNKCQYGKTNQAKISCVKELSLCHKLWFSNPYIFGFQRRKPLKFQTMTFVRSNNISLKYQRFTTLGSKDIGIRKSEFVAKNQFLYTVYTYSSRLGYITCQILVRLFPIFCSLSTFLEKICNWNKDQQ